MRSAQPAGALGPERRRETRCGRPVASRRGERKDMHARAWPGVRLRLHLSVSVGARARAFVCPRLCASVYACLSAISSVPVASVGACAS